MNVRVDENRSKRFLELVKMLNISDSELEKIGVTRQLKSKIVTFTQNVSIDKIVSFCAKYTDASAEYILTGRGTPLWADNHADNAYKAQIIHHPKSAERMTDEAVPVYDIEAAANLVTLFDNEKKQKMLGTIAIPNMPVCDGAIYVRGESMSPILKSGDIVAYKRVYDVQNIIWGEMYIVDVNIEGDHYVAVKYLNRSDKGEDWVKLVSHNETYAPKDVMMKDICAFALVKFSVRMNTMF